MTELATYHPPSALAEQMEYAKVIAKAGILPDAYREKPANVLIAMGLGQAMGLSPAESMYRINVIKGKPSAAAELIAANVRRAGHKLRIQVTEDPPLAVCTIIRADDPEPTIVTRDMAWAERMGLDKEPNYKKQPATMLSWRAISACARFACSEALYGVIYTPDEVDETDGAETPQRVTAAEILGTPDPVIEAVVETPEEVAAEAATDQGDEGCPGCDSAEFHQWGECPAPPDAAEAS